MYLGIKSARVRARAVTSVQKQATAKAVAVARMRPKVHDFITHKWFFIWITLFSAHKRQCNQNNTHTARFFFVFNFSCCSSSKVLLLHFGVCSSFFFGFERELYRDQPDLV